MLCSKFLCIIFKIHLLHLLKIINYKNMQAKTYSAFLRQSILLNNIISRKPKIVTVEMSINAHDSMPLLMTSKRSYCKLKYDSKVEEMVNRQIQAEQQAAQDYLSIAVSFLHMNVSRQGAGGFFMRMYKEELGHMQDFINYQLIRGGTPLIKDIKAPTLIEDLNHLNAFKHALNMETTITELLQNLVSAAENIKDYQCADFVTSVFLMEQILSVSEMACHVTKLARLCDNEHAIFQYDLHLAKCYPYSYKPEPKPRDS